MKKTLLTLILIIASTALIGTAEAQRRTHVVKAQETLYRIAKSYGVSVDEIRRHNPGLQDHIRIGQQLIIPDTAAPQSPPPSRYETSYHAVERGETLYSISRRYGLTVDDLLRSNPSVSSQNLPSGVILVIPGSSATTSGRSSSIRPPARPEPTQVTGLKAYQVPPGETVYNILRNTGWSEEQLLHYNPQLRGGLKSGMTILIPDSSLPNNKALSSQSGLPTSEEIAREKGLFTRMVLALPFSEDPGKRFRDYYEGALLALKEGKDSGRSIDLHVYDIAGGNLPQTIAQIRQLRNVDLIIGGVSDQSIRTLGNLAGEVGAKYVIPFTSKEFSFPDSPVQLFQVNTPHDALYSLVADKFVDIYKGYHVVFAHTKADASDKKAFVSTLKGRLDRSRIAYSEVSAETPLTLDDVTNLSLRDKRVVVIPTSSSQAAARVVVGSLAAAADSLGIENVTAFGYPDWQTYYSYLSSDFAKIEATFYSTFYSSAADNDYQAFQKEFVSWFGHPLASTFPKFGVLGYDTTKYFILFHTHQAGGRGLPSFNGIQSNFRFAPDGSRPNTYHNEGLMFIRYNRSGVISRF